MEAPFGFVFLKKAELWDLITRLDKQQSSTKNLSVNDSLWNIEKQILRWTYIHHKHLGSPIGTNHLSTDPQWSKRKEMGFLSKAGKLKKEFAYLDTGNLTKPLENLVERGFARYFKDFNHNEIVINKEGLLVGEVLSEIEERNLLIRLNYFIYSKILGHWGAAFLLLLSGWGILRLFGLEKLIGQIFDF